jgi:single-stranded-DNA-specific exonuclease
MAAGFSARKENLEILKTTLNENCTLTEKELTPKLYIDVPMPLSYVNMELTRQLSLLEPFGKGNEKPVFAQSGVRLLRATVMGKNKNVLKCLFEKEPGKTIEGIYFQPEQFISDIKQWFGEDECVRMLKGAPISCMLDVAYYPDINEYAGRAKLQIKILEYRKHED